MSKINETNYPRRTQANYADTDMLVIQAAGGNTYTTRLEDMRKDYEATLAPTLSALQDDVNENLATIEAGSTASKAYAKGDFLVFGGRLCKAKTSIAVNATLVLDTNIELASVGGELSSISSELAVKTGTFTTNTTNHPNVNANISVKQFGSVVSINGYLSNLSALSSTDARRLGTISGVPLPSSFIRTMCAFADHAYDPPSEVIYLSIDNSTGNVGVNLSSGSQSATNKSVYFSVCYVV